LTIQSRRVRIIYRSGYFRLNVAKNSRSIYTIRDVTIRVIYHVDGCVGIIIIITITSTTIALLLLICTRRMFLCIYMYIVSKRVIKPLERMTNGKGLLYYLKLNRRGHWTKSKTRDWNINMVINDCCVLIVARLVYKSYRC